MPRMRANAKSNAPMGMGAKLFASVIFLIFLGAGAVFFWLVAQSAWVGIHTWTWQKTDCQITASSVGEKPLSGRKIGDFQLAVKYRYTFGGQSYTSDQYAIEDESSEDYGKAAHLTEQYPPGASAVCYVNPSAPAQAVLVRYDSLLLFVMLFPLIFVVVGGGGIYIVWRQPSASQLAAQPVSARTRKGKSARSTVLFSLVFLLVGCGFFYGLVLRPLSKIMGARDWPAIPCVVVASEVERHSGGGGRHNSGPTYSINILYFYEFNGKPYKANGYDFLGGSSSGFDDKEAVVDRLRPGTPAVCYVNPADPTEAVLERGFSPWMLFGVIPVVFILIGGGGLYSSIRGRRKKPDDDGAGGGSLSPDGLTLAAVPAPSRMGVPDRLALKPDTPRWVKLAIFIGLALFWNGILSVFIVQAVKGWHYGKPGWFLDILPFLFLVPFVGIGLGLVGAVGKALLELLDPRPQVTVSPGAVPLGGTVRVEWALTGRTNAVQSLSLRLRGREESTSGAGKHRTEDKSVFANLVIAHPATPEAMRSGSASVTIPPNLMHSFEAENNKIIWSIIVRGKSGRLPAFEEEFPLKVLPSTRTTLRYSS